MLGWIIGGLLLTGAILVLTYTVSEYVRRTNLFDVIRGAFRNAEQEAAKKMLARVIKARIRSKSINVICIDALDESTGQTYDIQITSEQGVDEDIQVDDSYLISA